MIHVLLYMAVSVLSLAAIALNVISLPGNWIMMLAAAGLAWSTGWTHPSLAALAGMVIVLLLGETVEILGSVVGAKKFGATRAATWAAIAGAIVGAIVGTPIWLIGNIVGAILGAFLAAWSVELLQRRGMKAAIWAAVGAAIGRTTGIAAKLTAGMIAWLALIYFAWPGY